MKHRIFLSLAPLILLGACESEPETSSEAAPEATLVDSAEQGSFAEVEKGSVYATYGVHNSPSDSPCAQPNCVYQRGAGEPADPVYPPYWVSGWNMYVVAKNYVDNPPPYPGKPPADLIEGVDYEASKGTSYYDSTWQDPQTGAVEGAMMEHYEKRCLPIFPINNQFTCSFISLGDTAYFVTYEPDRPQGMPPVCLFSKFNHPPRRDFIKHLPYSKDDSERIGVGGQAYSFWVSALNGKPVQTGVSPDRTAEQAIMFGYGFQEAAGAMRPQSFYFSGYPLPPANAPIVSQNYVNFTEQQPDPSDTWELVANLDINSLPTCRLFNPPAQSNGLQRLTVPQNPAPTWSDIGRWQGNQ